MPKDAARRRAYMDKAQKKLMAGRSLSRPGLQVSLCKRKFAVGARLIVRRLAPVVQGVKTQEEKSRLIKVASLKPKELQTMKAKCDRLQSEPAPVAGQCLSMPHFTGVHSIRKPVSRLTTSMLLVAQARMCRSRVR